MSLFSNKVDGPNDRETPVIFKNAYFVLKRMNYTIFKTDTFNTTNIRQFNPGHVQYI